MWHLLRAPTDLSTATGGAKRFNFYGDDPANLGVILGHHLIFLGLGAIAFVELAKRVGIYDLALHSMRIIQPHLVLATIWSYQTSFLTISSLEDVISGHVVIAFMLTIGAVALMGFVASIWCASNTTVYSEDFFGPALNMKFSFSPYFADSINLPLVVHTARAWLANAHFFLAFFFLQGHFWHALRSLGFDFRNHLGVGTRRHASSRLLALR